MLPFKVIYHPRYDLNLGAHVFPSQKFRMIYELLLRESIAAAQDIAEPSAASKQVRILGLVETRGGAVGG